MQQHELSANEPARKQRARKIRIIVGFEFEVGASLGVPARLASPEREGIKIFIPPGSGSRCAPAPAGRFRGAESESVYLAGATYWVGGGVAAGGQHEAMANAATAANAAIFSNFMVFNWLCIVFRSSNRGPNDRNRAQFPPYRDFPATQPKT